MHNIPKKKKKNILEVANTSDCYSNSINRPALHELQAIDLRTACFDIVYTKKEYDIQGVRQAKQQIQR